MRSFSLAPRSGERVGARARVLIACAFAAACASTSPSTATSASAASSSTSTSTTARLSTTQQPDEGSQTPGFAPAAEGAKRYAPTAAADGRRPVPPDAARRALLADVRAAANKVGVRPPVPDPRLDWAMTDLAQRIHGDQLPALDVVEFLLGHYGLIEPSPHILMARASSGSTVEFSARARDELVEMMRSASIGRVGIGLDHAADAVYIVIGLQEKRVELLDAIPRQLPPGGHVAIDARLAVDLTKPELVITAPGGAVSEQTPPLRKGVIRGELRCGADGRYQVEIVASGATGSTVLANFPVYCGVAPPAETPRGAGVRPVALTPEEAEARILALINRDRKLAGVAPLAADDRLTAIARAHTHDMVDHDFVGHVSPRTGNTLERVRRAGLAPSFVSENVGRGYTADEAEQGFMASPGHRANIVDPRPHRVGVGVVFGAAVTGTRPLFVTQLFTD
jgi:uncharacterized protein YkwD